MIQYRLDVRPFLDEVGGGTHVHDSIELLELVVGDETFTARGLASFDVTVSNAGEALVAFGTVAAPVTATCVRCLCDFDTEIVGEIEGYWPRPGNEAPADQDVSGDVGADGSIDLGPALIAALVVEAPFAPLHDEECKGLCASCGADLNQGPCACPAQPAPGRPFAQLKDLLGDEPDTEK